jgi:hypothetical protein
MLDLALHSLIYYFIGSREQIGGHADAGRGR